MDWSSFGSRLRALFSRRRPENELDEELTAHIEFQSRKYVAQGLSPDEARRRACVEFGGFEQAREECREVDRWRWIDASARNLRHSFRSLGKSPAFTIVSILILTAGIGSNLAVFSTMDAVFLRPLPVERPDELIEVSTMSDHGTLLELYSPAVPVLESNPALHGVCGFSMPPQGVEIEGNIRPLGVAGFTGGCFETLGLHLQIGRPITSTDDHLGTEGIAVITDSLWQGTFGRRPDVLGKKLKIGHQMYTIVGVTQKGFSGLTLGSPQQVMIPLLQQPGIPPNGTRPAYYWVSILARRAPGVSEGQVRASVLAQRDQILRESVPHHYNAADRKWYLSRKLAVMPGKSGIDYFLRRRFGEPLYAIFGICAALLLIACVNLTTLVLARSLKRRHELAVRLALGAKRTHIAGMFALESAILVWAGAVAGIIAGFWTAQAILAQGRSIFGNFRLDTGMDERVLVFLAGMVLVILAIFTTASVWQAGRLANPKALKESGRSVLATNTYAQRALLGTQIALTLAFVTTSALFAASVRNMYSIDFGIDPRNLWQVELAGRPNNLDPVAYYRALLQQIEPLPNVQSASITDMVPFYTYDVRDKVAMVENPEVSGEVQARDFGASDNFLETLGARIVAGDDFRRNDSNSGPPTAILSESLARHFGKPRDLIGRHIKVGNEVEYQHLKVIGIASDTDMNLANVDDTRPFTIYLNFWQHRNLEGHPVLLIRTRGGPPPITTIRRIVKQKGYEYVDRVTTIENEIDNALVENRFIAYLSGAFSILALAMAAIGLFGLLSYQVANRTGEIGIRMALGAKRAQIQWLILRQIVTVLALGSLAGVALTFALGKAIAGLLYGVSAYNPSLLLFSIAVLAVTAVLAAAIPIHRASTVDPLEALRQE